jgi:hypothetical protein
LGEFNRSNVENPWKYSKNPRMAPFDQKFHVVVNLAVGGTQGYFPDSTSTPNRPWENGRSQGEASLQFWKAKEEWYPTWNNSEYVIDYIRIYASETVDKTAKPSAIQPQPPTSAKSKGKSSGVSTFPTEISALKYFFILSVFNYIYNCKS